MEAGCNNSGYKTTKMAAVGLFFFLYYLYLWLVVDLELIYHGGGVIPDFPVFYLGWDFFRESVSNPGGFVNYISAFFAQIFHIGWLGTLIATAQAWLLWLCAGRIFKTASGHRLNPVCYVLPILLLMLYSMYKYPFGMAMELLLGLVGVWLYMKLTLKPRPTDALIFLGLMIALHMFADKVYALFSVICGLYELLFRRRIALGAAFVFSIPIVGYIMSEIILKLNFLYIFSDFVPRIYELDVTKLIVEYVFYLLLPAIMVVLFLAELLEKSGIFPFNRTAAKVVHKKASEEKKQIVSHWSIRPALCVLFPVLPAIVAGTLVGYFCHKPLIKANISVSYYSCGRMWPEVLGVADRYPWNKFIVHSANRALFHTGRLAEDMFVYQQQPDALMLTAEESTFLGYWKLFDTYIDLGHVNLAESAIVLATDMYGDQPIFLKRLALIKMIKGDVGSAGVYLGMLSRTLFDAGWANGYLKKIAQDPNLSQDEQIQWYRSRIPAIDRDFKSLKENIFGDLLAKNKHNKMAFEYYAAFFLLTNQLDKFVEMLGRMDDFDYAGFPRLYEEAILIYEYKTKNRVEIPNRKISAESRIRFDNFLKAFFGRYKSNKTAALKELARDYGDSYLFYYIYGPGVMK